MSSQRVGTSRFVVLRAGMIFLASLATGVAGLAFPPVAEASVSAMAVLVPGAPAAVTPQREVVPVTASGPTRLTDVTLAKDAVWGPQGSPYVLSGQVTVKPGRALTLLPGTVVKFATQSTRLVVNGQLLSLGSPKQRVTFTSIKDDSVGGDTNGDGSATSPARGDWQGISVYSEAFGTGGEEVNPVSAFDYTDFTLSRVRTGMEVYE